MKCEGSITELNCQGVLPGRDRAGRDQRIRFGFRGVCLRSRGHGRIQDSPIVLGNPFERSEGLRII